MRLVVVSNRLPVVVDDRDGERSLRAGSGGLVSALRPIMQQRKGVWIGWPGAVAEDFAEIERLLDEESRDAGFLLRGVALTEPEVRGFYRGFSNEIVWPLFHDLQTRCNFDPTYWQIYREVNNKFTLELRRILGEDDFVWVHDYHLILMAENLRGFGVRNRLGFFLHIPFPGPDIFSKLPWRMQLLEAFLAYDLVGFQNHRDRENFLHCVKRLLPRVRTRRHKGLIVVEHRGRRCGLGSFPIGIDDQDFAQCAASEEVSQRVVELRRELPNRRLLLSVDRLDYTKGIPERLRAFGTALERYPDLHRTVTMVQIVVPSRAEVPEYQGLKAEIEQLVTELNGRFSQSGWVPIHHFYRSLAREELVAYYRAADVALVTPLKDGMNLVAKEYCASQPEGDGVLILSEFAGAAAQMRRDALIVNPYDFGGVADAIHHAFNMPRRARKAPMRRMQRMIRRENVFCWVDRFLAAALQPEPPPGALSSAVAEAPARVLPPVAAPVTPARGSSREMESIGYA